MSRTGPTSPFSVLRSPKTPARLHILGHRLIKGSTIPLFNETFETGHEHEGLSRVLLPVSGLWVSCGLGSGGLWSRVLSFEFWGLNLEVESRPFPKHSSPSELKCGACSAFGGFLPLKEMHCEKI